jgi:hypothetical protein
MAPFVPVEPCFGTGQVFFLDTPSIRMHLRGLSGLGPLGKIISNVMKGVAQNVLRDGFILPQRFVQRVRKDLPLETLVNMKSPIPLGMLEITVLEAEGLPAADTSLTGERTFSDPYVTVQVGYATMRTSTCPETLNPKWAEPPGHLFVYNVAQLVRVVVYDDDLLGQEVLGMMVGYSVYTFCKEADGNPDGVWFDLWDAKGANEKRGRLKLRVRYFDVADLGDLPAELPEPEVKHEPLDQLNGPDGEPPYVLTVKLLGLEGQDHGSLQACRATVEVFHAKKKTGGAAEAEQDAGTYTARLAAGLQHLRNALDSVKEAAKRATGIGFGKRENAIPMVRKSGKAEPWGKGHSLKDQNRQIVPQMAIRAMERLHMREQWPILKVANMFQLDAAVVRAAVALRGNFDAVWYQALHFLQPAEDPFHGYVVVKVEAPKANQVRGADDKGYIGSIRIELDPSTFSANDEPDGPNSVAYRHGVQRRIRGLLKRPRSATAVAFGKDAGTDKAKKPDFVHQVTDSATLDVSEVDNTQPHELEENSGILIELLVEVRALKKMPCQLDEGQTARSKAYLIQATMSPGIEMIPEAEVAKLAPLYAPSTPLSERDTKTVQDI